MSDERLNPDQIAALFDAARNGQVPDSPAAARRQPRVRSVDFSRPTKFSTDHQRRISRAVDTFCVTAGTRLTAELRAPVELETINTAQATWSAAQSLLPARALTVTLEVEPLGTQMVLLVESSFILCGIECLLGGAPDRVPHDRRFSEIDGALSARLMDSLVGQLSVVWRDLGGISLRVSEIDQHSDASAIASVSEPTFGLVIEARLAKHSSSMALLIPWQAIDAVQAVVAGRDDTSPGDGVDTGMTAALAQAPVSLRAEVAAVELPVAEILGLEPGAVIRLGGRAEDGISLFIENTRLGRARPGTSGSRRAVQVLGVEMD